MASDAMLPESTTVDPTTDAEGAGTPRRSRGRRRKPSLLSMVHAELSAMLFMLALGLWIALILLSAFFPFGSAVNDMQFAGIVITVLAALTAPLFLPAVIRFWVEGDRFGSVIAAVLALATIGNWLGWYYHFNLPSEIGQLIR